MIDRAMTLEPKLKAIKKRFSNVPVLSFLLRVILVFVFGCFSTNLNAKIKGNSNCTFHNFERSLLHLILWEFNSVVHSITSCGHHIPKTNLSDRKSLF